MTIMPTYAVSIRTKTISKLGLKENQIAQARLANVIVNFRSFSYKSATDTIFAFVYGSESREELLNQFGFTSIQEMSEKYDFLTNEQITILGNELRYQFKESHPDFLKIESEPGYQEEMSILERAMGTDPILLYRVVEACEKCHESRDIVAPCVELLMSENPERQKNGLQRMGNNEQYQNLLQPYAEKIGNLLQAMCDYSEEQKRIQAAQQELNSLPSPFAQISEQKKEAKLESPTESHTDVSTPREKFSLSDKLSEFISKKSEIVRNLPRDDEFWACLKRLRDLGVDLNYLLDNDYYLLPILEAHDHLDEAITTLYDAEQAFDNAKQNFQMSDMHSIHVLSRTGAALQDAQKTYNYFLDAFVSLCMAYEQSVR